MERNERTGGGELKYWEANKEADRVENQLGHREWHPMALPAIFVHVRFGVWFESSPLAKAARVYLGRVCPAYEFEWHKILED